MGLMRNLFDANFPSPEPIINKNGNYVTEISGKKSCCCIFFRWHCKKNFEHQMIVMKVGVQAAKLHLITKNLVEKEKISSLLILGEKFIKK